MQDEAKWFPQHNDNTDPDFAELSQKREVRKRWEDYVQETLAKQPTFDYAEDIYIIRLDSIWTVCGIPFPQMATFPNRDPFIRMLQLAAMRVLDRRELNFENQYIYAIADPDHAGENLSALVAHGFVAFGLYGYEMDLAVLLTKEHDEKDFDLFFALHWAQLDFTDSFRFFRFHLKENFKNDLELFTSYMRQIFWQYKVLKLGHPSEKDYMEKSLLTESHDQAFSLWLEQVPAIEPLETGFEEVTGKIVALDNCPVDGEEEIPTLEQLPIPATAIVIPEGYRADSQDLLKTIMVKSEATDALFNIFSDYFEAVDHPALRHVLGGHDASNPLVFKGQCNCFVYAFRECHRRKIITSFKKVVRDWIVKNFYFINYKTGQVHHFDRDNVKRLMSSTEIPLSCPLDISQLDQFSREQ